MRRQKEVELALERAAWTLYDLVWHMPLGDLQYKALTEANEAQRVLGRPISQPTSMPRLKAVSG